MPQFIFIRIKQLSAIWALPNLLALVSSRASVVVASLPPVLLKPSGSESWAGLLPSLLAELKCTVEDKQLDIRGNRYIILSD